MDRQEDLELLSASSSRLLELIKRNPQYHKSLGMGQSFSNYVNQHRYGNLLQRVFDQKSKSIELLQSASQQMDRFQRTIEKTTYAALDYITTIDKNKIEPRLSEIDVLSATILGDEQLKKLSQAIAERIIFDN